MDSNALSFELNSTYGIKANRWWRDRAQKSLFTFNLQECNYDVRYACDRRSLKRIAATVANRFRDAAIASDRPGGDFTSWRDVHFSATCDNGRPGFLLEGGAREYRVTVYSSVRVANCISAALQHLDKLSAAPVKSEQEQLIEWLYGPEALVA